MLVLWKVELIRGDCDLSRFCYGSKLSLLFTRMRLMSELGTAIICEIVAFLKLLVKKSLSGDFMSGSCSIDEFGFRPVKRSVDPNLLSYGCNYSASSY